MAGGSSHNHHNSAAPARLDIKAAYQDLESVITPNDSRLFYSTTLEDVRNAAIRIEEQLAARQSLCNMGRLERLFGGLQHYSKSIDVLCNGTPYLPWLWAPITLILQVGIQLHPSLSMGLVHQVCFLRKSRTPPE